MSKVFVSVGMSLDGFIAGLNGGAKNPLGDGGTQIHKWIYKQKKFQEMLKFGEAGETGKDNDILSGIINRIGANIMGKKMFVEGEANWPEEAPFHSPVYVLTNQKRKPWERPGGTTFYFVNEDIHAVLEKAKKAARNKDVRISGGASCIQQYLNAGLIDEYSIHLTPFMMGKGVRLFENIDLKKFSIEIKEVINSSEVTHLFYKVNDESR